MYNIYKEQDVSFPFIRRMTTFRDPFGFFKQVFREITSKNKLEKYRTRLEQL